MKLKVSEIQKLILTHRLTPAGPLPTVLDADGVYPYQSYCETSARPVFKNYNFIKLENAYLAVLICPDLGGKVYSIIEKESGKEVLYVPGVIRPSRILPRFSFVAGGIEVSFPISHTPSQNEKVCHEIVEVNERIYVCVGETELRFGMQWTVEYSLGAEDRFLTQRTVFYNPTNKSHPWMSWSNAAFPAYDDTEFHFPNGKVLKHSDKLLTIDWENDGPKTNADIDHMSGYFWQNPDVNAFGCYSPSQAIGLYHVPEREQMPGIKLWSYGTGRDKEWSYLSSLSKQSYLEIQAGPIADQSIKHQLSPGQKHSHTEYWIPSCKPMNIRSISIPDTGLRPIAEIPLFSFAREEEVMAWQELQKSYELRDSSIVPNPPAIELAHWAPGGLYELDNAFKWIIKKSDNLINEVWQLYYGIWLLANNQIEEALKLLKESGVDMAMAILARVYSFQGRLDEAKMCYESMNDDAFKLHPQIVVERDRLLAQFGSTAFAERMKFLDELNALNDEMLIERRIALLIDMENYKEARILLLNTKFQLIHQRYERKKLWATLCLKTNTKIEPFPKNLGEDNLAQFGAYREFEIE